MCIRDRFWYAFCLLITVDFVCKLKKSKYKNLDNLGAASSKFTIQTYRTFNFPPIYFLSNFQVGCCGANGSEDYIGANKPVPFECRDVVTGNEFGAGCCQALAWWLEPWTAALVGFSLGLFLIHIIQIVATTKLKRHLRKYEAVSQEVVDQ